MNYRKSHWNITTNKTYIKPSYTFKSKIEEFLYYNKIVDILEKSCISLSKSGLTTLDLNNEIIKIRKILKNIKNIL